VRVRFKLVALVLGAFAVLGVAFATPRSSPSTADSAFPPIQVVASPVPGDIAGGAQGASIQTAAAFAWQEFIALNWPAVPQTGALNTRDTPDLTCGFDDQTPRCKSRPLVWQTFRNKVEIFPGGPGFPAVPTPPGYSTTPPSYGYDARPEPAYQYSDGVASPCPGQSPVPFSAWVNLDETDQIGVDAMFAGAAPATVPTGHQPNSQPQLIRFLAKANRAQYSYLAGNGWLPGLNPGAPPLASTQQYVIANLGDPAPGDSTNVSFPNGTIEIKTGWRLLTNRELTSGRWQTATVRYYENASPVPCWRQDTFGMTSLHIIQKTPSAPYFIYATFEQADNILTSGGQSVENDDGSPNVTPTCPPGQASPCPTTPTTKLADVPSPQPSMIPPRVVLVPPNAKYCPRPQYQLYYLNEPPALPTGGFVCVNSRVNPIPPQIVAVNAAAQQAIRAYAAGRGPGYRTPLVHYKLVNVQYAPINKTSTAPYAGTNWNTYQNPANYYLANITVETNRTLQFFSGGLIGGLSPTGANSDYPLQFPVAPSPTPPGSTFQNVRYRPNASAKTGAHGNGFDMGGCMGCHGAAGQLNGGDFSVITVEGSVAGPEIPLTTSRQIGSVVRHARHGPRNRTVVGPALLPSHPAKGTYR
jgi:hypothetical protein